MRFRDRLELVLGINKRVNIARRIPSAKVEIVKKNFEIIDLFIVPESEEPCTPQMMKDIIDKFDQKNKDHYFDLNELEPEGVLLNISERISRMNNNVLAERTSNSEQIITFTLGTNIVLMMHQDELNPAISWEQRENIPYMATPKYVPSLKGSSYGETKRFSQNN
jgi:hypothetical protein